MNTESKTFYSWEARIYEYYQLRWRYRWLIRRNDTFYEELKAVDRKAFEKGILGNVDPIFGFKIDVDNFRGSFKDKWRDYRSRDESEPVPRIPFHRDYLHMVYVHECLPTPGYDRFKQWMFGYAVSADELEELATLMFHTEHEAGREFLSKYDLVPPGVDNSHQREYLDPFIKCGLLKSRSFHLDYELSRLRTIAEEGGWGISTTSFDLHAWWYEMLEEAEISCAEISRLTDEHDPTFADYGALRYMCKNDSKLYKKLCRLAEVPQSLLKNSDELPQDRETLNRILVALGRLKIGAGKDDFGIIAGWPYEEAKGIRKDKNKEAKYGSPSEYPKTICKNKKYYLPAEFPFDLVEYFTEIKKPEADEGIIKEFMRHRNDTYLAGGSSSLAQSSIRTAVNYMKKKIDQVKPLGTIT